jgi:VWA domain containing CoxE-like protein
VFTFATRLTRLTGALAHMPPEQALQRAGQAAPDWLGGTRIGASLKEFNDTLGRPGHPRTTCWPRPPGPRRTTPPRPREGRRVLTGQTARTGQTAPLDPSRERPATPPGQAPKTSRRPPARPWPAARNGWRARTSPS